MTRGIPPIVRRAEVINDPKAEGERVGKLLRKYTITLQEYKAEAEYRMVHILESMYVDGLPKAPNEEAVKKEKVFWKTALDTYKEGMEIPEKAAEETSKEAGVETDKTSAGTVENTSKKPFEETSKKVNAETSKKSVKETSASTAAKIYIFTPETARKSVKETGKK